MKWGITSPRLDLLLCAVGIHAFDVHCASRTHGRETRRECYTCGYYETRLTNKHRWGDNNERSAEDQG